jgi:protein TonB
MFEGSLIESRGLVVTGTERWATLGSITFQCGLAGLLIAIPLLRPQALPTLLNGPLPAVSMPSKPPVTAVQHSTSRAASNAMSAPAATSAAAAPHPFVSLHNSGLSDSPAPSFDLNLRMTPAGTGPMGIPALAGGGDGQGVAVVRKRPDVPVRLSSGVTQGMLLTPIQPVYPAIARAARVQGAVVMEAVISMTGKIESLHAISGPQMLRPAALSAVQDARYQPYMLDGQPTEVQTTITVIFQLGR